MSNLFDGVPEGTTHRNGCVLYKFTDDAVFIWSGGRWAYSAPPSAYNDGSMDQIIARPKQWSGPEDGLPPAGTVCEVKGCMSHYLQWNKVTVFAVRGYTVFFDMEDGRWGQTDSHEFRAIPTPDQKRETAIRELMDIAQVDCRVTAARLVDAGFKREVV